MGDTAGEWRTEYTIGARSNREKDVQAATFASTKLKDVWSAVREIDSKQRKRQSAQNLRRVDPLLRGIENYAKVVDVLCNGTPFMPYAWVRTHSVSFENVATHAI
jgi:hypothetical protein